MMRKIVMPGLLMATLLTGCTVASGPTYNAYAIGTTNGASIYKVECHGLLTDTSSCQKAAARICDKKAVNVLETMEDFPSSGEAIKDPRVLRFQCGNVEKAVVMSPIAADSKSLNKEQHYEVVADTLFAFGQSDLRQMLPAGRAQLDKLISDIDGDYVSLKRIVVTGYTDRIGSAVDNLLLSHARAATVRDYLVAGGLDPSLIQVVGAGASNPVVSCSEGNNATVIACLQPNRRVSIDVSGTRK